MILNAMVQCFMLKSRISIIMQIYFSLAFQAKLICSIRNSKSMDMLIINVGSITLDQVVIKFKYFFLVKQELSIVIFQLSC